MLMMCMLVVSAGPVWATPVMSGISTEAQSVTPSTVLTVVHGQPDPMTQAVTDVGAEFAAFQPRAAPREVEEFTHSAADVPAQFVFAGKSTTFAADTSSVPEPSTLMLVGLGALALIGLRRRNHG